MMVDLSNSMWAITSYFNPAGFRRRLSNFQSFRQSLNLPLIAVELSFDGAFHLQKADAEILIQLAEGDVMWQKERLLNVALDALPSHCTSVVTVDADVLIGEVDWPQRITEALEEIPLLQPFSHLHHLNPGFDFHNFQNPKAVQFSEQSMSYRAAHGEAPIDLIRGNFKRGTNRGCAGGVAFAARREVLDKHRFFDACVIGGGDSALSCAMHGCLDALAPLHYMNDFQRDFYLKWASPLSDDIDGMAGSMTSSLFHLWHGHMQDRRPRDRHLGLQPFCFDPNEDIALTASGTWQWNSDKPLMHEYVRDYFLSRREDG